VVQLMDPVVVSMQFVALAYARWFM